MPLSNPLLPVAFIRQVESHDAMRGFRSSVYERNAHEERLAMRKWVKPLSPDHPVGIPGSTDFTQEAQRTWLHFHVMEGDVLAMSELIGLGATPDKADSYGQTPLHLAFLEMAQVKSRAGGFLLGKADRERLFSRLVWVTRILIEQHADINITVGGDSLIDLSCSWKDWDTITLLLEHGATTSPSTISHFRSVTDRKRLSDLLKSYGTGRPRPPRICPCWSGKVVSDCHGRTGQPYPLEYICVCGSAKSYQRCCHKRGKYVVEKWDNTSRRILHDYDRIQTVPVAIRGQVEEMMAFDQNLRAVNEMTGTESSSFPDATEIQRTMAADLLSKRLIDPAFAYAMNHANFPYPRPHGRNSSHYIRRDAQTAWNKLVDDYIDQSGDPRPREDIEKAAKVGSGNGAFLRTCEGVGCGNNESKEQKFNCCSKCKLSKYCSRRCQKTAWATHKTVCCSQDQHEQSLPSQVAIQKHAEERFRNLPGSLNLTEANAVLSRLRQSLNEGST